MLYIYIVSGSSSWMYYKSWIPDGKWCPFISIRIAWKVNTLKKVSNCLLLCCVVQWLGVVVFPAVCSTNKFLLDLWTLHKWWLHRFLNHFFDFIFNHHQRNDNNWGDLWQFYRHLFNNVGLYGKCCIDCKKYWHSTTGLGSLILKAHPMG